MADLPDPSGTAVEFDLAALSLEAIRRACHEISHEHALEIRARGATATVSSADGRPIPRSLRHAVLDHQVRLDTEERFRTVRELILAQAFAPCDNLAEIVKRCQ